MEQQNKKKAPIIADGKTLDELAKGNPFFERMVELNRKDGMTDEEIWEDALQS